MTASATGRVLGLDVGERRIGVAISDPDRHFALPLHSVDGRDRRAAIKAIGEIAAGEDVSDVVVGLPLTMSGELGAQAETTKAFAADLEAQLGLPVVFWDERLSTQEALSRSNERPSRRGGRDRTKRVEVDTDALAASIILQAYLDRQRFASRQHDRD